MSGGSRTIAGLERDALKYGHDGCYVHPACLTCPLPECLYDLLDRGALRRQATNRDAELRALHAAGATLREIKTRLAVGSEVLKQALGGG